MSLALAQHMYVINTPRSRSSFTPFFFNVVVNQYAHTHICVIWSTMSRAIELKSSQGWTWFAIRQIYWNDLMTYMKLKNKLNWIKSDFSLFKKMTFQMRFPVDDLFTTRPWTSITTSFFKRLKNNWKINRFCSNFEKMFW